MALALVLPLPIMSMQIPPLRRGNFHASKSVPHIAPPQHLICHCANGITFRLPETAGAPLWGSQLGIRMNVGAAFALGEEVEAVPLPPPDTPETQFISVLLLAAFLGLALLTFGVIYLTVKDYQEKRQRDKLLKREKAQEEKDKRSKSNRAKSGPKGFGQKNRQR